MGNCSTKSRKSSSNNPAGVTASTEKEPPPEEHPPGIPQLPSKRWNQNPQYPSKGWLPQDLGSVDLLDSLEATALLLGGRAEEASLTQEEITAASKVYQELQRVLSSVQKTGDRFSKPDNWSFTTPFHTRYEALLRECDAAAVSRAAETLSHPAAVQPVTFEALNQVDFMILDNSLRETTVGVPRGHTLDEKHAIVKSMADTELKEVILGSFGSKISVDSQIAQQWLSLGKTFDQTWGFSECYDMEPFDEEPLWQSLPDFFEREAKGESVPYYVPPQIVKCEYSKEDHDLFKNASKGFRKNAFGRMMLQKVLKQSESPQGRVPLGLLMLAGHGICNAIIEIDTAVETFDYDKFDIVKRCCFLIDWCKTHLPRRKVPQGQDDAPRVLINLRDFSNYNRSKSGMENTLRLVDALSSLPPSRRPFGFMMEEPTVSSQSSLFTFIVFHSVVNLQSQRGQYSYLTPFQLQMNTHARGGSFPTRSAAWCA